MDRADLPHELLDPSSLPNPIRKFWSHFTIHMKILHPPLKSTVVCSLRMKILGPSYGWGITQNLLMNNHDPSFEEMGHPNQCLGAAHLSSFLESSSTHLSNTPQSLESEGGNYHRTRFKSLSLLNPVRFKTFYLSILSPTRQSKPIASRRRGEKSHRLLHSPRKTCSSSSAPSKHQFPKSLPPKP